MEVEWLILADAAQMSGGKLYLLGGGWDVLTVNQPLPVRQPMGIAVAFRVPWNETNQRHNVDIEVLTDDGSSLAKIGAQIEVGRPVNIPVGSDQRAQIAAAVALEFKNPGTFSIVARVEGLEQARTTFRVVEGRVTPRAN